MLQNYSNDISNTYHSKEMLLLRSRYSRRGRRLVSAATASTTSAVTTTTTTTVGGNEEVLVVVHYIREQQLQHGGGGQVGAEDDSQVDGERIHAPSGRTVAHHLGDKGQVEEGGVGVDELEEKYLYNHAILILRVRPAKCEKDNVVSLLATMCAIKDAENDNI